MTSTRAFALFLLISCIASPARAADPAATLRNLKGCFEVTYRFVEDGTHDYDLRGGFYEWIDSREEGGVLTFQHFGVHEGVAQKHWSEQWNQVEGEVWSQKVFGPFGDFRYGCQAPFVFNQWRCVYPSAPKPVRDTDRTDYVRLQRENTLQITPKGWIQNENNVKKDRDGQPVANEVGWIEYKRVEEPICAPAQGIRW